MGYSADMKRCLKYIEEHLDEEISALQLAQMVGYSFSHFCHVFRVLYDVPVGEYLRSRRLYRAAQAILGGQSITAAAFDAGFESAAGFAKAFRRQFGMSATKYRHLYRNRKAGDMMQVQIVKQDAFQAVGYSIFSPEGDRVDILESGAFWYGADFSAVSKETYAAVAKAGKGEIGTWTHPEDVSGNLSYFFGVVVDGGEDVPPGLMALTIPAAEFAVFTVGKNSDITELRNEVQRTWKYIFGQWFEESEYEFDQSKMNYEYYLGEQTQIFIPVKKK